MERWKQMVFDFPTSSQQDGPARIYQLRGRAMDSEGIEAGYGQRLPASSMNSILDLSSLRTARTSETEDSNGYCRISGRSGLMRSGTLYQRQPVGPFIRERDSGLLPTPNASDFRDRGNLHHPCIQRRQSLGKQIGLSMLFSKEVCPSCVEGMMGIPKGWTERPSEC